MTQKQTKELAELDCFLGPNYWKKKKKKKKKKNDYEKMKDQMII